MKWLDRLVDWWWDMRNATSNVGNEWDPSYPALPEDMDCPDTEPTSPGALDSDLGRLQ